MEQHSFRDILDLEGALVIEGLRIAGDMFSSGFPLKVFWVLVALVGALTGIKILLEVIEGEGFGDAFEKLIQLLLSVGVFLFLLNNYEFVFGSSLKSLFDAVAAAGGFGERLDDPISALYKMLGAIAGAFKVIFPENASWFSLIGAFFVHFFAVIIFLAAIIIIIGAIGAYVIVYLIGDALAGVAIALGPFFVALGVWDVTRGWFKNWLEFLVNAFMYKVVAAIIVLLISKVIARRMELLADSAQATLNGEQITAMLSFLLAIKVALYAGVVMFLVLQTPQIAHGLARGGMSYGEEGLKKLAGIVSGKGLSSGKGSAGKRA
ncbi:type IV secretion system protein [Pelomicrobium methylotrophicum]|uniref:TrbL/VirB6 plasmid conjugal transfer protein n=1 Tax=Pelomicrobium methylotrophicum TaxID=2602750 RepID=A0A5C7EWI8_9PROT|nr:type IV secretion system protein [Pelomicrobium methylotrophicum]TXF11596.1 hypothetical protein FR698_09660 [Pelomicrobium methylotrophicum]